MADTPLLVPDRRVVSIEEAKHELESKRAPRGTGSANDFVTRKELIKILDNIGHGIGDASVAVGQRVFDQIAEETSELLEQMHHTIRQEMYAEFERRSLRGRLNAMVDRARGYLVELGVLSPIVTVPVLVQEVDRDAALAELRSLLEGAGPNMEITLPEGTTVEDADRIQEELRAEREQAVEDVTPKPLSLQIEEEEAKLRGLLQQIPPADAMRMLGEVVGTPVDRKYDGGLP